MSCKSRDTLSPKAEPSREGEHPGRTLSNFQAHEVRVTGEIILHMSRWMTRSPKDWTADALQYRITVE
jgi:hypothetical protein